jgi:hypothetical protein
MSAGRRGHALGHTMAAVVFLWGGLMSMLSKRAEHYGYLANEFRRLAANDSSVESGQYYVLMARHYRTLAEAAELKTTLEASEPRLGPSTVPA